MSMNEYYISRQLRYLTQQTVLRQPGAYSAKPFPSTPAQTQDPYEWSMLLDPIVGCFCASVPKAPSPDPKPFR
jgi:hypothetical protein